MNQIIGNPNSYDFGLEFNYAVWPQDTSVTLVNVPWNNDYRDVVRFANRAALNNYIDSLKPQGVHIEEVSYLKQNQPIRLPLPINVVQKFNYLRASNFVQPVPGADVQKDLYYFVTDVRYLAPNTTEVVLQLDVWQSFIYEVELGNSYIERGHIGIAAENSFSNYGRDLLTVPEGLDVGGEYVMVAKRNKAVTAILDDSPHSQSGGVDILVCSSVDLLADPGTIENPKLTSAKGGDVLGLVSGANFYVWENNNSFNNWLADMKDFPWITQGIMSITLIPKLKRYNPDFEYNDVGSQPTDLSDNSGGYRAISYDLFPNWRESAEISGYIPSRFRHLKKLYTFPYMAIELTCFQGNPVTIKPEAWAVDNATIVERSNLTPPNQRIGFHPLQYNARAGAPVDSVIPGMPAFPGPQGDDNGEYIDFGTYMNSFPTVAIVNNAAIGYLAANAHSLAYQRQSSDWSQQRALGSAQASYDIASAGIDMTQLMALIDQSQVSSNLANNSQALADSTLFSALTGGLGAGVSGALGGGVGTGAGAAIGGTGSILGASVNQSQMTQAANIANNATSQRASATKNNQSFVRDTNKNLADWAARGDYANSIAGINAKVQDANLIQPTVSGQMGGDALNYVNNQSFLSMRVKMIDLAAIRVVGDFWLRYGYAIRRFAKIPANFMVMSRFTYWKLSETYISAAPMPEGFKQAIRGIFEKGVTVWSNPADIGQIDLANNTPLEGITL